MLYDALRRVVELQQVFHQVGAGRVRRPAHRLLEDTHATRSEIIHRRLKLSHMELDNNIYKYLV